MGSNYDTAKEDGQAGKHQFNNKLSRNNGVSNVLHLAVEQSPYAMLITDVNGVIRYANYKFLRSDSRKPDEIIGGELHVLFGIQKEKQNRFLDTVRSANEWTDEVCKAEKSGKLRWEQITISPIMENGAGAAEFFLVTIHDITEQKNREKQLVSMANCDPLTKLLNRNCFYEEMKKSLAHMDRYNNEGALLYIDIDNFKQINDTHGHKFGDDVIENLVNILHHRVRDTDIVGRMGGDEFVVLLFNVDAAHALLVAGEIIESVEKHNVIAGDGQAVRFSVSIGISLFPYHGRSPDVLLSYADIAMYRAKGEGRNRMYVYDVAQEPGVGVRLNMKNIIRKAIDHDRLALHLQPVVDIKNRSIAGYEGLLRIIDDNDELIYPTKFIDIAEQFNFTEEIDRWVISKAIRLIKGIQKTGANYYISVNLSKKTFIHPELLTFIKREMAVSAINPKNLLLEVSESSIMSNMMEAQYFINILRMMGCRVAIDDFGTGIKSLSYLKQLPANLLKIDGGFICDLLNNQEDRHLIRAIAEFAGNLRRQTIAKSVPDEETIRVLDECGVNYIQGHYIGKPQEKIIELNDNG
ncbi:MAG: GGDEF and EAL domain-containing protein [Candidatus Kuenenia stuttgartiensis]|nr:GGDEF and EAL domain-containing protein [Candidatus Kuenenia stuttgartiensis]